MAGLSGSQELISNSSHHSLTDNSIGARSLRTAVHLLRFRACRVAATMLFAINAFGAVDCMAAVAPSPTTLSWVAVPVGGIGAQKTVTLTNSNAASITISGVTLSGANAADFKIYSKTCGATLAAAASCTAKIAFAPTTTGARTATLNFKDSAGTQTVSLAGNGTAPSASVSASPTSLTFAAVTVGSSSAAQSVTLSNKLTTSITISSVAISGTNAADFTISSKTCGTSLAASGSCTASVVFKPSAAGTRTATLRFTDSASNSPQSVALSGAGVVPGAVTVSPTSLAFGSINVGSTAAAQTATLKNGGTSSITITSVSISGTNAADFSISSKTCGTSLATSASCTVSITFKPAAAGARTATLSIVDSAKNSPQMVSLSGTGVAPAGSVTIAPTSLGFANTEPGATSFAQIVTLNNGTKAAITISGIALGGTNPGDFAISSKTCGLTLGVSASCTVSMVFKPTVAGTRSATLSFTDSGTGSPRHVALSGSSTEPFAIQPTNPTVIVNDALQFSATTDVTWATTCGTIGSTSGIFSAPSTTGTCTVTATELEGTHAAVSTSAKITSSPASGTLGVYPTSAAVYVGTEQIFQAQLSTIPDGHSLTYSIDGVTGGNATTGTITNVGVYTAPTTAGTHHLTVKDNLLGTTATATIVVFSKVTVDFAARATTLHVIPPHIFGAERLDSLRSTADLDLVKAGGIRYARFYALIPTVFKTSTPNWASIDAAVQRISAGGVKVMLQIYQTPPWLQPASNPCGAGNANALPTDLNAWGKIAAQYVEHMDTKFPGVVTDYEIWNEPNTTAFCVPADQRLTQYMKLYSAAAPLMRNQIKTDRSSARVGGPATAGMQSTWVNAMLADPLISQQIDYLSYHDYMFSNVQLGAQWDTYNGTMSVYQKTQNTGDGPLDVYLNAAKLVGLGKQPQGKNLPIYNSEYNLNWNFSKNCCANDPTYSPVWNGMYIADVLNSVYVGAPNTPSTWCTSLRSHSRTFAWLHRSMQTWIARIR